MFLRLLIAFGLGILLVTLWVVESVEMAATEF